MHLRYYLNEEGKRVYTLKTVLENGDYTFNAHPGIFFFIILTIIIYIFIFISDEKIKIKPDSVLMIRIRNTDLN
jgi:hypothetical protein